MQIIDRIPFLNRLLERRLFKQEMAALNKRFKKQDDLYDAIDLEKESWIDAMFCPVTVNSDFAVIEGFVKSDGKIIGGFIYMINQGILTFRELNNKEKLKSEDIKHFEPLDFDFVTIDGWYSHSEGWNNQPGCSPGAAVGAIENDGEQIAEFAFCFRCRKIEIKPTGYYLGKIII
mgnify:CR=1 FL=1|tara:strand:+ start:152 stop:676 length:525 start_codon:yes stop_codon:yes gene_type:complete